MPPPLFIHSRTIWLNVLVPKERTVTHGAAGDCHCVGSWGALGRHPLNGAS